jgi:hypothetical protein
VPNGDAGTRTTVLSVAIAILLTGVSLSHAGIKKRLFLGHGLALEPSSSEHSHRDGLHLFVRRDNIVLEMVKSHAGVPWVLDDEWFERVLVELPALQVDAPPRTFASPRAFLQVCRVRGSCKEELASDGSVTVRDVDGHSVSATVVLRFKERQWKRSGRFTAEVVPEYRLAEGP